MRVVKYLLMFLLGMMIGRIILCRFYNVYDVLWGISSISDTKSALYWNWLILPVIAVGLTVVEQEIKRGYLKLYRYNCLLKWWSQCIGKAFFYILICYTGFILYMLAAGGTEVFCLILITVHAVFLLAIGIVLRLLTGKMIVAAITLLLSENFGIILSQAFGLPYKLNITVWGMKRYISEYIYKGFYPLFVLLCQALFIMIVCFGIIFWGKERVLRRLDYEKNDRTG